MSRPTVAIIDLDAIAFNMKQIRRIVGPGIKICPAVKADGYGHGAPEISRVLERNGADMLSVATPEEAIELREAGISLPTLLLGCVLPEQIPLLIEYQITSTICDLDFAQRLSVNALASGSVVNVHIKVDTGMGRIGVLSRETVDFVSAVSQMKGLHIEGIFTHFPSADEDDMSFTHQQIAEFGELCEAIEASGIRIPICHAANSAAILNVPDSFMNMVRPGIMVYGHCDFKPLCPPVELRPALTLKSKVVFLKTLPAGCTVSYGRTYVTGKKTVIATVPIGYADGYSRRLSNKADALVHGMRVPVVGTVCMDQMMLDVSQVPDVRAGDEVVLYGKQGGEEIAVEEIAQILGTISYEVLCSISKRVPRLYTGG